MTRSLMNSALVIGASLAALALSVSGASAEARKLPPNPVEYNPRRSFLEILRKYVCAGRGCIT